MKVTPDFKKVIQDYLNATAKKDKLFAETLKKKNKNIDDCITYILNTVKASGNTGFADDEIFNMAMHYYDEDDLKPGNKIKATVVHNRSTGSVDKKPAAKKKPTKKVEPIQVEQTSLF